MNTCPRRIEDGMADDNSPFSIAGSNRDQFRYDNTCSYCGSFNPDVLMERIEAGTVELGPTDKNYKVYLRGADGSPFDSKFYFQHFSEEQKRRFIELLNEKKLKIGYPGRFYVTPFFIRMRKETV